MSADPRGRKVRRRCRVLVGFVVAPRSGALSTDLALIGVRAALAWIFVYHGSGKLFGAFNGPGIHRTALYFSNTAHLHPGGLFAVLGGVVELGGGVALALGVFSRVAGLAIFGDMVIAMITVSWANGINSETPTPGYELNMALAVLGLLVALLGAGRASVDEFIERRLSRGRAEQRLEAP